MDLSLELSFMYYELLYIIPNKYSETEYKEINQKIKEMAQKENLEILTEEDLGKKKLAYPIKHFFNGYYLTINFKAENKEKILKFEQKLKVMPEVLRHQIVKYKDWQLTAKKDREALLASQRERLKEKASSKNEAVSEKTMINFKDEDKSKDNSSSLKTEKGKGKKVDLSELDKKIDALLKDVDI